jgi:hypothetical protein
VLFAVIGGAATWLLEIVLVAVGSPVVVPPFTLGVALALIGALVIGLAVPVRRAVKERESQRIDPFYATRVVVLAKASSIAGGLLVGAGGGILVFLITRSVVGVGSISMAVVSTAGAIVLLVAGLAAEHMCSIPPEDGDKTEDGPAAARPH